MTPEKDKWIEEKIKAYDRFCRDMVYVCAYCEHCLSEVEIENHLRAALSEAWGNGYDQGVHEHYVSYGEKEVIASYKAELAGKIDCVKVKATWPMSDKEAVLKAQILNTFWHEHIKPQVLALLQTPPEETK